jgi:hypothetical protein
MTDNKTKGNMKIIIKEQKKDGKHEEKKKK